MGDLAKKPSNWIGHKQVSSFVEFSVIEVHFNTHQTGDGDWEHLASWHFLCYLILKIKNEEFQDKGALGKCGCMKKEQMLFGALFTRGEHQKMSLYL